MADLRVGVVGGTRLPGNVRTFLDNVGRLLSSAETDIALDLLVRADCAPDHDRYTPVDPGFSETERALETVWTLTEGLTAYVSDRDPDLLWQVTKFPVHGTATAVAGHRTGVPVLTRFAGDNFREYELATSPLDRAKTLALNNGFGRVAAALSDATVVLGPHGRDEIESHCGEAVYEIPQPVDRRQFHPTDRDPAEIRTELGLPTDDRLLVTVGRVSRRKGMEDLAATARDLVRRNRRVTWCVLGNGPLRARVNASPVVRAVGRVPHAEIPQYYRAADLVVHPSKIEGLPNVLLEAAACGTPTLSRDVGDSAEVASATYDDPDRLPALVERAYEPIDLPERFSDDRLRTAYERALVETARR